MLKGLLLVFICSVYLLMLALFKQEIFFYRYDDSLTEKYLRSQDIYDYTGTERIILSDNDIYLGAGYLYATGADPAKVDFQHPPLIKYLFGFSSLYLGNPYLIQIFFGFLLICLTFFLAFKYSGSTLVSFLAVALLILDPLMIDVSSQAFLDLGLSVFTMLYIISLIYYPKKYLLQGIFLGLAAASKFWSIALFFFFIPHLYKLYLKDKLDFKKISLSLVIASLVFLSTYIISFIYNNGMFNFLFFILKQLNFMLHHTSSSYPGSNTLLFLTGYFFSWWDSREILRYDTWSPLWPALFVTAIYSLKDFRKFKMPDLIKIIPIVYLLYINTQASFTRYFILALPYFYIIFSNQIISFLKSKKLLSR